LREVIGKTPLHDDQDCGLALAGCDMGQVIVDENSPDKGNTVNFQQLQFFTCWFRDHLPLFSIPKLLENSPLISGHVLAGNFLHVAVLYFLEASNPFFDILYVCVTLL
jgi:hypothetical protein